MRITRLLKVSTSDGKRIKATIYASKNNVRIVVEPIFLVTNDNPPFLKNGVINVTCTRKDYQKTLQTLTKYLEDLFLKGLNDGDIHTSTKVGANTRRTESKNPTGYIGINEGEGRDTSVHARARREESTKSTGGRKQSTEVDSVSDKDSGEQDKGRD